ncbi:hypothetical protein QFZ83_006402 [Variovorax sp. W1I1]|uniref:hypothetical protein n=1 Tax=Variovorax sp. W1I1 TaxID=3042309 RepID=UPI002786BE15|nr:hypothetical protein [Variovorax sp. W1I1]MDQ0612231.1 hypothetical protein [Variovorax sp. W1I1]
MSSSFSFVTRMEFNSVVIIDSLPPTDPQTGMALYGALSKLTPPNNLRRLSHHFVENLGQVQDILKDVEKHCHSGERPVLHFEAHGNADGFGIQRGAKDEFVEWSTIAPLMRQVNAASQWNLGVFFGACEGMAAIKPISLEAATPFQYLIAPTVPVYDTDIEEVAKAFYPELLKTSNLLESFRTASIGKPFKCFIAEEVFAREFGRVMKKRGVGDEARKAHLEDAVRKSNPSSPEQAEFNRKLLEQRGDPAERVFSKLVQSFLPGGISFSYAQLVEFLEENNPAPPAA